jgi:hypothetical protein
MVSWSTPEKELYPTILILRKEAALLLGIEVQVYTDHRNLKFLMNPDREERGPVLRTKLE